MDTRDGNTLSSGTQITSARKTAQSLRPLNPRKGLFPFLPVILAAKEKAWEEGSPEDFYRQSIHSHSHHIPSAPGCLGPGVLGAGRPGKDQQQSSASAASACCQTSTPRARSVGAQPRWCMAGCPAAWEQGHPGDVCLEQNKVPLSSSSAWCSLY